MPNEHHSDPGIEDSFRLLLTGLRDGDRNAIERVWNEFFDRLVSAAKGRVRLNPSYDEEDIALSAMGSLYRGAEAGRLDTVANRDELWYLLLTIAHRKIVNRSRYDDRQKRGGGRTRSATDVGRGEGLDIDAEPGSDRAPDLIASVEEERRRLLGVLTDDVHRIVALRRLEGYTVDEIATELGVVPRTVERKLARIRKRWSIEVET